MTYKTERETGFTLIELIIIMIIISVLAALISGNFLNSLQKGRDARRKNDLAQVQRALELYYEDNKTYPSGAPPFGSQFCKGGCLPGAKVYMMNTPADPNASYNYSYIVDPNGQYYYLLSCIENYHNDKSSGVSNGGYCNGPTPPCDPAPNCGACGVCKFVLGSPNAYPLTPKPTVP